MKRQVAGSVLVLATVIGHVSPAHSITVSSETRVSPLTEEVDNSSRCPDGGYRCEVNGEMTCDCPGWGASLPCNPGQPQGGEFDPHNYEGLTHWEGIVLLPIS